MSRDKTKVVCKNFEPDATPEQRAEGERVIHTLAIELAKVLARRQARVDAGVDP